MTVLQVRPEYEYSTPIPVGVSQLDREISIGIKDVAAIFGQMGRRSLGIPNDREKRSIVLA